MCMWRMTRWLEQNIGCMALSKDEMAAVLCGSIKGFGEDALGKDLRVGAARQLCQLRVGQQTVMQGSKQHPVGVGELALKLLVDLQNDLVQRLLGVVAESTLLGDWAVMLGSPFSITAPAGRASSASRHSTIATIRFACFMFRSFPPAPL